MGDLFSRQIISYDVVSYPMITNGYKLRMIGGSLMVTIPQEVAREFFWKAGDYVAFEIEEGGPVTIEYVGPEFPKQRAIKPKKMKPDGKRRGR